MSVAFPVCVICFYPNQYGELPPSLKCFSIQEAYTLVCMRQHEIQCVMLNGDLLHRNMTYPNYEAYLAHKNTFSHPLARGIFHRIVGPYHPEMRREWEREQKERRDEE